jgi:hypothetical protein
MQHIRGYVAYLQTFSTIRNLRTRHAVVTRGPLNMENIPIMNEFERTYSFCETRILCAQEHVHVFTEFRCCITSACSLQVMQHIRDHMFGCIRLELRRQSYATKLQLFTCRKHKLYVPSDLFQVKECFNKISIITRNVQLEGTYLDLKVTVFCDVASWCLVKTDRRFRGAYCLYQGDE